ncbi:MAG TPA: YceI family protein [Solirubrobacteraceae bacterium]|nr:YceI family protein [Solirubrobacteraceae bacterium]
MSCTELTTRVFAADPTHSRFGFDLRSLGGSIYPARFEQGDVTLDLTGTTSTLAGWATVESISIHTPDDFRNHVLGPDSFDAERHPDIAFRTISAELRDAGGTTVEGELTVRGVTTAVTASGIGVEPSIGPMADQRTALTLQTTVNRRDFASATWRHERHRAPVRMAATLLPHVVRGAGA